MKRNPVYILLFLLASLALCPACDDENFSANPSLTLAFSHDTLRMDTVLTGIGTATSILKVYNRNKESLVISSIILADAANSGFRINVDAMKGNSFTDVEIRGKDSLFIFVEATLSPQDSDEPIFRKDSIVFITNTNRQDVKLQAYGQDFVSLRKKEITQDTLITSPRPIVIYDSLSVKEGAKLTIGAGTRFYFHGKSSIQVHGQLVAEGTLESPVVFRGDRTDRMFSNLPYDRLPGQWDGIRFHTSSYENSLNFVDIHGGIYGIRCDSAAVDRKKLTLTNSVIRQVSGNGLEMTSCQATIGNCEISNAGNNCVSLLGGDYEFVHCTLANYYSWDIKKGVALALGNERQDIVYPITMAAFRNCIIAGSSSDEISGSRSEDSSIPFNYYFSYCLVNSTKEENDKIVNVVWKKDDNFLLIDKKGEQLFDFQLTPKSAAIDIGLVEDARNYPLDLKGMPRTEDKAPDAGCYEWKEKEEEGNE
ncbi:hypothetical protein [Bacteroides sp.]